MKNTKNYYTPKVEEFYVGFEYEIASIDDNWNIRSWNEKIFDLETNLSLIRTHPNYQRVRYLNNEDIKSFGLNHVGGKLNGTTLQKFKGKVEKGYYLHITSTKFSFGSVLRIETSVSKNSEKTLVVHSVTIKNKSELKKLLTQLNII